ncbi:MAG TPA: Uma2 family endonuclease [Tepidisphaeraceae bacterium]|jgi:Uma2 family endonuclease|nr:Uma2 family endonuclease [Tepidisphaeraceae bacterium]
MTTLLAQPPAQVRYTPDDILRLEEEGLYELVDGRLVEKSMSSLANETAWIIGGRLFIYLLEKPLGVIFNEQTFKCFPNDAGGIRRPDLAFVSAEKLPRVEEDGHVTAVPDIAIEVISPNDKIDELEEKIEDYFSAGVKIVWAVNPKFRWVRVHRLDAPLAEFRETDTLTAEPVLPGFAILVRDMLARPHTTQSV